MAASRIDLVRWFTDGKKAGSTHMIVVCDTFDYDDYPVYAKGDADCLKKYEEYKAKSMTRIMEVYDLHLEMGEQMEKGRVWNLPPSVPA